MILNEDVATIKPSSIKRIYDSKGRILCLKVNTEPDKDGDYTLKFSSNVEIQGCQVGFRKVEDAQKVIQKIKDPILRNQYLGKDIEPNGFEIRHGRGTVPKMYIEVPTKFGNVYVRAEIINHLNDLYSKKIVFKNGTYKTSGQKVKKFNEPVTDMSIQKNYSNKLISNSIPDFIKQYKEEDLLFWGADNMLLHLKNYDTSWDMNKFRDKFKTPYEDALNFHYVPPSYGRFEFEDEDDKNTKREFYPVFFLPPYHNGSYGGNVYYSSYNNNLGPFRHYKMKDLISIFDPEDCIDIFNPLTLKRFFSENSIYRIYTSGDYSTRVLNNYFEELINTYKDLTPSHPISYYIELEEKVIKEKTEEIQKKYGTSYLSDSDDVKGFEFEDEEEEGN